MFWKIWRRGHQQYRELLSEHLDGRLDVDDRRRLEQHLATCDECVRELESLRATVGLLQRVPMIETPRSFQLQETPAERAPRPALLWSMQLSTAMAAMLLVALVSADLTGVFGDGTTPLEADVQTGQEQLAEEATSAAPPPEVAPAAQAEKESAQDTLQAAQPSETSVADPAKAEEDEGDGLVRKIEIATGALAGLLGVTTLYLTFQRRRRAAG